MPVITTTQGKQFAAAKGESLLDAALRADVSLAYSCRTGRCSTCRSRVLSGTTEALHEETGLAVDERAAGWILSCVRAATSDALIEFDDLGDVRLTPAKTLPCRIHSLELVSDDVLKVTLRLPPNSGFSYRPGQYIDVIGHGGLRRSYSIANAPAKGAHLELHIRRVPGGAMSDYWFALAKPNDLLRMNGPLGTFFLRDAAGLDLVFLSTGTGIAPVKAMLEGLAEMAPDISPRSASVYWGGRTPQDIYWNPGALGFEHRFIPVLSRANAEWAGARGHVQNALLADNPALGQVSVYACGSDAMIHSASEVLTAAGLPARRFHSDAFVCSAAV